MEIRAELSEKCTSWEQWKFVLNYKQEVYQFRTLEIRAELLTRSVPVGNNGNLCWTIKRSVFVQNNWNSSWILKGRYISLEQWEFMLTHSEKLLVSIVYQLTRFSWTDIYYFNRHHLCWCCCCCRCWLFAVIFKIKTISKHLIFAFWLIGLWNLWSQSACLIINNHTHA